MQPVRFLDGVVTLALQSGVRGKFTEALERVLYDRVLYERQDAPPDSELASFYAVEGRKLLSSGRSAVRAPPTVAELFELCSSVP
jgi:hypothetical protein